MVAKRLCQRVSEVELVLAETVFKRVQNRVASGLVRLYQSMPPEEKGTLRVTHQEIANLVGSTRETTTAVLHHFRKEGILTIANRRVIVLDPAALERAARSG
jgi:CRP/FNR family transcriptional regulator